MVGTRLVPGPPDPALTPKLESVFNWRIVLGGAAGAIGETCGSTQVTSAPQASGASSASGALPGLNSLSGAIPNLSNAASVVPNVGNAAGSVTSGNSSVTGAVSNLVPGNGEGGLNSVSNAVGGITGGLSGRQNGGTATGPLP
jgi:hypothetical protein